MTFFNKKEEVLDVQLTSEGRRQLALGKLKPAFYQFYDDNVLYDVAHAGGEEEQNFIQDRILDDSPYPKTSARFRTGKSKGSTNFNKNNKMNTQNLEVNVYLKESPYLAPLGSYDSLTQNAPYFEVSLLSDNENNLTTGSSQVVEAAIVDIPQLNITSSYRYYFHEKQAIVYAKEDPLLMEIREYNTQFGDFEDNFEIEVFEITGSNHFQPKLFIIDDYAPRTPTEENEKQLKFQAIERDYDNLLGESLDVLLDEETERLFPSELITKKRPNAKPSVVCEEDK
jgi:hypothetical protein|tara:strand:- start:2759 stop:3607 length:849 start_codon:yes stop_codon:yes gene_type:complete